MIGLSQLKRLAAKAGVPQGIVEKDIALSGALRAISDAELAKHVVFKGGTAIRKIYFKEARFSEDLDFTVIALDQRGCSGLLKEALEDKTTEGIVFEKLEERPSVGLKAAIKYLGPLGHAQRIRLDFSFRENLSKKPIQKELIDTYSFGSGKLLVLSLEEILAEKLHALGSRSASRDLYDVWFLLEKGIQIDKPMLDQKFAFYNEEFDAKKAIENARKSKDNWTRDLRHLLKKLPEFEQLEREVERKLQKIS